MNSLIELLRNVAPALATAVAGPMGGLVVKTIAEKLGVEDKLDAVVTAIQADPEAALKLREIDLKQFEIDSAAVTDRWKADMLSDSWLSKNIRPLTLAYILTAYIVLALLDGAGYKVAESYVELLGQWGMLVMTAYFGGRTVEKIMDMRGRK